MAKFCGKCGSRLDENTWLCTNCDVRVLRKNSVASFGRKTARFWGKFALVVLLLCAFTTVVIGVLVHYDVLDVTIARKDEHRNLMESFQELPEETVIQTEPTEIESVPEISMLNEEPTEGTVKVKQIARMHGRIML